MSIAEKIACLRKQRNWSQEELAEQLSVTRQAVSKWESGQSMPDLDKIVQLSAVLGVSTDYLLKDESQSQDMAAQPKQPAAPVKRVTGDEAKRFLELQNAAAPKIALGVGLCVWSPIVLIGLSTLAGSGHFGIPENFAGGLGLCVLLGMVAAAVALFLTAGSRLREFSYLDSEPIEADAQARAYALSAQSDDAAVSTRYNTIGVVLCIVSAVPLFAAMCMPGAGDVRYGLAVCVLLLLVGVGCLLLVRAGMRRGGTDRLLEQGDYTRESKAKSRFIGAVSAAYWLVVTAIFLFYTFGPNGNGQPQYSWVIWAVGGVLYGALMAGLSIYRKRSNR